ncbi:MAG: Flp pilus assembly protein CpaB [Actinomycetota bacterium]|nr:Flp pilus assembly protein CpaB [Actinomycetota bacterium]
MADLHAVVARVRRLLVRFRRPLSALLAAVAVLTIIDTLAPASPERRPVVVAAHDLTAGVVLSAADVTVVEMPPNVVPSGSAQSAGLVIGDVVAAPLRTGEALTDRRVVGRSLVAGYPRGMVAAPIRIRDAGVVGLLEVGDRIDVYAARRDTSFADLVVAGARVVALPRPGDDNQEGGLVVLAVTPTEAAALAQASATAPLSLTLLR